VNKAHKIVMASAVFLLGCLIVGFLATYVNLQRISEASLIEIPLIAVEYAVILIVLALFTLIFALLLLVMLEMALNH